ncbi:MAG: twin transmembrane helix small protein [Sphingomonadaceae bacterium]|nr:twin transmembrane helix small protein [Sphingomonadaceae bacterium]
MNTVLIILLLAAMAATLFFLVKGIITFLRTTEADLTGTGTYVSGRRQNKAMQGRILFQAVAIVIIVLILVSTR